MGSFASIAQEIHETLARVRVAAVDKDAEWQRVNSYIADVLKDTHVLYAKLARLQGDFGGNELELVEKVSEGVLDLGKDLSSFSRAFYEGKAAMVSQEVYGGEGGGNADFGGGDEGGDFDFGGQDQGDDFDFGQDQGGGEDDFDFEAQGGQDQGGGEDDFDFELQDQGGQDQGGQDQGGDAIDVMFDYEQDEGDAAPKKPKKPKKDD